jgi:hypothetical protein
MSVSSSESEGGEEVVVMDISPSPSFASPIGDAPQGATARASSARSM